MSKGRDGMIGHERRKESQTEEEEHGVVYKNLLDDEYVVLPGQFDLLGDCEGDEE